MRVPKRPQDDVPVDKTLLPGQVGREPALIRLVHKPRINRPLVPRRTPVRKDGHPEPGIVARLLLQRDNRVIQPLQVAHVRPMMIARVPLLDSQRLTPALHRPVVTRAPDAGEQAAPQDECICFWNLERPLVQEDELAEEAAVLSCLVFEVLEDLGDLVPG